MADTDQQKPAAPPVPSPTETSNAMSAALEDRSKYIRTMAKDMVALTGAPQPVPQAAAVSEPPKEERIGGVTLPVQEQPFFDRSSKASDERPQERVDLPSMQEAGSIVETKPATEAKEEDREAILERLRRKVGQSAQMTIQQSPAPVPVPVPAEFANPVPAPALPKPEPVAPPTRKPAEQPAAPVSAWSNVPAMAPAFAPLPEPPRMPPVTKETYREPIETVEPPRPIAPPASDLHTYTSDFADRIDERGASTFSVLAAEQDSQRSPVRSLPERKERNPKAVMAVVSGIALLLLAGGGIYGTYRFVMTMRDTPIASLSVPSIVFADEYRELSGTGPALLEALAASSEATLVPGNVLVTYMLAPSAEGESTFLASPAGGATFVRALGIPAPDILVRNISEDSTVGIVNAGAETRPFFALRVDSYERTYAGMLTWEPLMFRDLALLYPLRAPDAPQPVSLETSASSTAATTTASEIQAPVQASALTRFADAVVANRDVRILRDANGESLILYGYADKRTLIIARDEAAFEALLARLKGE